ncbi:MAG: transposase [Planctomycetaceae bacterium]
MAQERLKEWLTAARSLQLKPLDAFCQTVENWLPMIANYFTNRSSNGPTEGFNRGFRTILWQAFGMTNFRHFRLRILDRFNQPQTQLST